MASGGNHIGLVDQEWRRSLLYSLVLMSLQIPYIETSAKDPPLNVDAAFHEVVRVIKYVLQEVARSLIFHL